MLRCGVGIRRAAAGADSMEEAVGAVCRFLYDELISDEGERNCVLVRCYKTHPFGKLKRTEQEFARKLMAGDVAQDTMKCLTLLATVGDEPKWNDRKASSGHRAIPLPRPDIVEKAPMIAQLIRQFGLDLGTVIRPSPDVIKSLEGRSYGVFHVENALGSPYIPAQDFVREYGIRSVVGCGGSLRGGDLFALILFTRVDVPAAAADRFRTLALDLKSVLFGFAEEDVFAPAVARPRVS